MYSADCTTQDRAADCIPAGKAGKEPEAFPTGPARLTTAGPGPSGTASWDLLLSVQVEESLLFQLCPRRQENLEGPSHRLRRLVNWGGRG